MPMGNMNKSNFPGLLLVPVFIASLVMLTQGKYPTNGMRLYTRKSDHFCSTVLILG